MDTLFGATGRATLAGVPEDYDALVLGRIATGVARARGLVHVACDDARLARLADGLQFFVPSVEVLRFPAWDCLPYDRVSPNGEIVGERVDTLCRLAAPWPGTRPRIVLTTVNALLQRVPPRADFADATRVIEAGVSAAPDELRRELDAKGYGRTGTVREPGEYAIRGDIVDIFPPARPEPVRIDLFGDTVERIRSFDAGTQRSGGDLAAVVLGPVSEIKLDADAIAVFRTRYREAFGSVVDDPIYVSVSEGRKHLGMEHWLPLFFASLETLLDYVPGVPVTLDHEADAAREARLETIADYYEARRSFLEAKPDRTLTGDLAAPYRPLPPELLYLDRAGWDRALAERAVGQLSPFAAAAADGAVVDFGGRRVADFAAVRAKARSEWAETGVERNVFDAVRDYIEAERKGGRRVLVAAYTPGSRERLAHLLAGHGLEAVEPVESWEQAAALPPTATAIAVLGVEHGFTDSDLVVIGEQDILGDRMARPARRRRRAENFIADISDLAPGDLVVHVEHGIGRYEGLEAITVSGAPHDCLRLTYAGGDRLFVPVENIEVLTRYGSGEGEAALDKLGGVGWQSRKAKLKQRLRDMAGALMKVAAARAVRPAPHVTAPAGAFEEFCARFPYAETEDQLKAINETIADLDSGRPMDRLICGDVGFGKTEVAVRAAFVATMSGLQVAIVVPTTLLARQHYALMRERFAGLPVRVEQLSRLSPPKDAAETRAALTAGKVDIVVGTHALLAKSVSFSNLGLLVVDEEQHFGVAQKERLKQLRADVHVLTLTATPIPRTLQMAMAGVKDMSLIATPPVDRLAVRTFVLPFDPVVIREAIMREHFRGGQTFYVCPRIEDIPAVETSLRALVPEIRIAIAHGRMRTRALEDVMNAFYDRQVELLLSTQIIESGLDIPSANTLVVHRADMFGLSQLYQLRGRVGRSKIRAYCYLTVPPGRVPTPQATKRLEVLQALDTLGAGFTLASHDLDIRGAGNLLGEEQSGHIREVGIELYQQMLEEAIAEARGAAVEAESWSPHINIDLPVLIPETYVVDLGVRLGLYRRIAALQTDDETESFAAEMIDRFGPLPTEVDNLLRIVALKRPCHVAGVEKLDVGPKGAVVTFRRNAFANPSGLVAFITAEIGRARLRPDHRLVYQRDWTTSAERLKGATQLARRLAQIAEKTEPSPALSRPAAGRNR
ncbi:MAG: transcription-repair coupling factor [Alphaproteobacteria bacterium]|nr:transcription-repair coupling factor [Alphaproteobacteria bacterium]